MGRQFVVWTSIHQLKRSQYDQCCHEIHKTHWVYQLMFTKMCHYAICKCNKTLFHDWEVVRVFHYKWSLHRCSCFSLQMIIISLFMSFITNDHYIVHTIVGNRLFNVQTIREMKIENLKNFAVKKVSSVLAQYVCFLFVCVFVCLSSLYRLHHLT